MAIGLKVVDSISTPIKIYCDNSSVVFYSKNNKRSLGSKDIEIKYLVVREKIKEGHVIIKHIGIDAMIAGPLTKALPIAIFKNHVVSMGLVDSFVIFG